SCAPLPRSADPASGGTVPPAGTPHGCRSFVSLGTIRPGSCPRSSVHAVSTWWSPFDDAPTGYLVPAGSKGYTRPTVPPTARPTDSAKPFRPTPCPLDYFLLDCFLPSPPPRTP